MTIYSFAQLEKLWIDNGGNPAYAGIAAGIAIAESGGNSQATNHNTNGSYDVGLWQINGSGLNQAMFDPVTNVKAAISMSKNGVDWHAWCTAYTDAACGTKGGSYTLGTGSPGGRYAAQNGATAPASSLPGGSSGGSSGSDPTCLWAIGLPSIGPIGGGHDCILTKTEARALLGGLLVTAGGIVFIFGMAALVAYGFKSTGAVDAVAQTAKLIPGVGGAAAKGAAKAKSGPSKRPAKKATYEKFKGGQPERPTRARKVPGEKQKPKPQPPPSNDTRDVEFTK